MTVETFEWTGPHDRRLALSASGALHDLNRAGVLGAADVHVARTLARVAHEQDEAAVLAAGFATRAIRLGSVAVDLTSVATTLTDFTEAGGVALPGADLWSDGTGWTQRVADSALARQGALVVEHDLVYLQRYHHQEVQVVRDLQSRAAQPPPPLDEELLDVGLARVFPGDGYAEQRLAADVALRSWTSVITGGPGTGKTTTVAGVLALLAEQVGRDRGAPLRVGLAAPTGKAAARIQEAVRGALVEILDRTPDPGTRALVDQLGEVPAVTLHRLLGRRPDSTTRFRHDRQHRLPHDVVLVDESSMVSLTHMARLLEALRPTTRLVLVGDADQLVSVDAGAVLADLVAGAETSSVADGSALRERESSATDLQREVAPTPPLRVARLRTSHRFGRTIGGLAGALRRGDADAVVAALTDGGDEVTWVRDGEPTAYLRPVLVRQALEVRREALAGHASRAVDLLDDHRLLCAHREGPHGVRSWNTRVERWITEETGDPLHDPMYVGRPLLVTANDYATGVFNGDTGVVVASTGPTGAPSRVAVVRGSRGDQSFGPSRLGDVETMHAMTIHKSQGGQAREVTVLLPEADSPLLTRELLYTAVTRAQERVRVVGSEDVVRAAVERRVVRASGLLQRLA
ncbi:MAG TPA: exodeoxyribonuclease V subunit alpha [Segeticoccus sp.]|nr:exodeoxyribonuclease V subunit alpha [Segeticoccus sp.]